MACRLLALMCLFGTSTTCIMYIYVTHTSIHRVDQVLQRFVLLHCLQHMNKWSWTIHSPEMTDSFDAVIPQNSQSSQPFLMLCLPWVVSKSCQQRCLDGLCKALGTNFEVAYSILPAHGDGTGTYQRCPHAKDGPMRQVQLWVVMDVSQVIWLVYCTHKAFL